MAKGAGIVLNCAFVGVSVVESTDILKTSLREAGAALAFAEEAQAEARARAAVFRAAEEAAATKVRGFYLI